MKKNKIILFSSSYPYGLTETFLHNEVLFLKDYFDIEIYPTLKQHNNEKPRDLPENVTFHEPFLPRSYLKRVVLGIFNFAPLFPYLKDILNILKYSKNRKYSFTLWFVSMITERSKLSNPNFRNLFKEDISSHILYFYWAGFPLHLIPKRTKNVFVRVHGKGVNFERNSHYIPLVKNKFKPRAITFLPISDDAFKRIKSINPAAKCTISRLGVHFEKSNPLTGDTDKIRLVTCSNVIALKRIHLIIEALQGVKSKPVEWIHFGDGVLLNEIKGRANNLPKNVETIFKGRVSNKVVLDFYKNVPIDLFVNVSLTEGVPVSIMEALSFGIPCFATNVGGTSEILNTKGGKLVKKDFDISVLQNYITNIKKISKDNNLRAGAFQLWKDKCNAEENYIQLSKTLNQNTN